MPAEESLEKPNVALNDVHSGSLNVALNSSSSSFFPTRIKSFVKRSGRLTTGQQRALTSLGPTFIEPFRQDLLDWEKAFGRAGLSILEIGFGMGEATAQIAALRPQDNFLGVEVHDPGVGTLIKRIEAQGLSNIRIIQHDAVEVLEHMIAPLSLDGVHIFFPDPWHKKRHHKRRLIQKDFVALLVSRLKPGGVIHAATDWEDYAQHMLQVMRNEVQLSNVASTDYVDRPAYRPQTKFESRGLRLGHGIWDIMFKKLGK